MVGASVDIVSDLPQTFVLWDVDHTLIENGGVSKETYSLAFELLTGRPAVVLPATDGRTDFQIMRELLAANSIDVESYVAIGQFEPFLLDAMARNAPDLPRKGYVLPGVLDALTVLSNVPNVVQSVLTGNIAPNALAKLAAFDLDRWVDLDVGGFGSDDIVRSNLVDAARRKVADKYGRKFDRTSTILVGDTLLDVKAAQDGGAKVIAVATGVYTAAQLAEAGADVVLENIADLDRFLNVLIGLRNKA
ncbi:MAG TPA: HAD hydrolase-like protein [Pseudonocardiaceae bacterium]|jgi:phosphoglycolate phosphatase-like HAD superfamily hydrolase|nr:HAD hydrolase-like protein [Pseudonocardiaceae bacterium]